MTLTETLLVLSVLADSAPYTGYGWRVEQELANRERAAAAQTAADNDLDWRAATVAIAGAEARLARLLDVPPQPLPPLDYDDGWGNLLLPQSN